MQLPGGRDRESGYAHFVMRRRRDKPASIRNHRSMRTDLLVSLLDPAR